MERPLMFQIHFFQMNGLVIFKNLSEWDYLKGKGNDMRAFLIKIIL